MNKIIREFYGCSDPNVTGDLFKVVYQKDTVVIHIPGRLEVKLTPMTAERLGEVLSENSHLPGLLAEIQ